MHIIGRIGQRDCVFFPAVRAPPHSLPITHSVGIFAVGVGPLVSDQVVYSGGIPPLCSLNQRLVGATQTHFSALLRTVLLGAPKCPVLREAIFLKYKFDILFNVFLLLLFLGLKQKNTKAHVCMVYINIHMYGYNAHVFMHTTHGFDL